MRQEDRDVKLAKRPYSPPTLKFLGSVADVTRGSGGTSADAMAMQQP